MCHEFAICDPRALKMSITVTKRALWVLKPHLQQLPSKSRSSRSQQLQPATVHSAILDLLSVCIQFSPSVHSFFLELPYYIQSFFTSIPPHLHVSYERDTLDVLDASGRPLLTPDWPSDGDGTPLKCDPSMCSKWEDLGGGRSGKLQDALLFCVLLWSEFNLSHRSISLFYAGSCDIGLSSTCLKTFLLHPQVWTEPERLWVKKNATKPRGHLWSM